MNGHRIIPFITCILGVSFVIFFSFLLPEKLLTHQFASQLDTIQTAPSQYYQASGTALAKKASKLLSPMDRVALITGTLKSTCEPVSYHEASLSSSSAASLAIQQIEFYYKNGVYPVSLVSDYENWYSYTTELYCYTDKNFETYSSYLYQINFTKYDQSLTHTILMTEDGTILYARMSENAPIDKDISKIFKTSNAETLFADSSITIGDVTATAGVDVNRRITITYPNIASDDVDNQNCYLISILSAANDPITYYVYQYNGSTSYCIGILPDTSSIYNLSTHKDQ